MREGDATDRFPVCPEPHQVWVRDTRVAGSCPLAVPGDYAHFDRCTAGAARIERHDGTYVRLSDLCHFAGEPSGRPDGTHRASEVAARVNVSWSWTNFHPPIRPGRRVHTRTMSNLWVSRHLRWAVPGVVAMTVTGAVAAGAASAGTTTPTLPFRTAAELISAVAGSNAAALSGTVQETSNLGLPALPSSVTGNLGPLTLATGTNTLRVSVDGPDKSRVALIGQLAEYDVVHSGKDVWTYSNQQNQVEHYVLPAKGAGAAESTMSGQAAATPAQAAGAVLAAIDPSTEVRVGRSVMVAGRPARQLLLTPKVAGSLVGSVRVAVDAATSVPLRVQVFARANTVKPAFQVGFTHVAFTKPAASVFKFTPPAGARVSQRTVHTLTRARVGKHAPATQGPRSAPTTMGSGWASIVVIPHVGVSALTKNQPNLINELTTRVAKGRMLSTALVSVLLTDDGRLLVGAVSPDALLAAAGR